MNRRKLERVAVLILSVAMLISSTGIMSSLAANVSESSVAPSSTSSQTETSTSVAQEGGEVTTSKVAEEGGSLVADENGNGTAENPYKISNAEQLLSMTSRINLTTSSNKNFVLTSDIDLSGITEADFAKNGGYLVTVNKAAAKSSENVFFTLDGNGHKLTGLNVSSKSFAVFSIFGYVNAKSTIKNLKIEKPQMKSANDSLAYMAVLVSENYGTVKNVEINYPVLTASAGNCVGLVSAVNYGTISNVTVKGTHTSASTASAENHTVSASGSVGAAAGKNLGTISNVSAVNIGMYVPQAEASKTVYGTIAGRNEGTVSNSVATGNVFGGKSADIAGGIVGKAGAGCKLTNNYAFVTLTETVSGCGVIGSSGTADMINDCFWSSTVSRRNTPVTNYGGGLNDISTNGFKVIRVGETAKITEADVKNSVWGKAVFALDGQFKAATGEGAALSADATAVEITGKTADSVAKITYPAKVTLPASIGAGTGSVTVKQYMYIYVFTVPKEAVGTGTAADPLVVKNSAEFGFLNYAQTLNIRLGKDIAVSRPVALFAGVLDGNGHTVTAKTQIFKAVTGKVKNLNAVISEDSASAVFGNLYGAEMTDITVSQKDGVKLNAENGNIGLFANKIADKSVIDGCSAKGTIVLGSEKLTNIGGFAGVVCGKGTKITNSGAVVNISEKDGKKAAAVANFIGLVNAEEVILSNCYAAGTNTAGRYMFIGAVDAKSVSLNNNYLEKSSDRNAAVKALDFDKYNTFANEKQFSEWKFDSDVGFFTGNGGRFSTSLPAIRTVQSSKAGDFKLVYDASKVAASASVENGRLTVNVSRANGVVTVKAIPVKVVNNITGLSSTIYVSNGLEKDSGGNWIVSSAYDLAYIGENIEELSNASFVMSEDVDMSVVKDYSPIGSTAAAFSGKFDGKGHTVSNLTINGTAKTAMFGTLSGAEVKNIKLTNAKITSEGGYAAVLAGQATGKTVISNITVENSSVAVNSNYAAIIAASVDNASGVKIDRVSVKNCSVKSDANYVGAVAGRITDNTAISNIDVDGFKASGSNYISGAVGLAQAGAAATMNNIRVNASELSGVSEISGIASGIGKGASLKDAEVTASEIKTAGTDSAFTAGGIAAVYGSAMENVSVAKTKISAGAAGGIVGKTNGGALVIKNASVSSSEISAADVNTVAAGILAVHNAGGKAEILGGKVGDDVVISGAAVSAGIVGDCSGADSVLSVNGTKTFASVSGENVAAGALARVGASAVNNITLDGVKVGGSVSGSGVLGGFIGFVKNGEAYSGKAPIIANSVAYPQISVPENAQAGMIIGGVETGKVIESDKLASAVVNTVISTYYGEVSAYSAGSKLAGGGYTDMDKPDGSAITSSVPVLTTAKETEIKINNLPSVKGYAFDKETGWASESDERIQVVSCTENTAVLNANHLADISVVGYYTLSSDSEIKVPVHFRAAADIRTPLKGSGTKSDPYLVTCAYDLETVAHYDSENAYFVLTDDIVFTSADFEFGGAFYNVGNGIVTIGSAESGFKGSFDGKGHSITGFAVSGNTFGALFGAADGAVISNLVINNANVEGLAYAAVIAGSARNTTISNITINSAKVQSVGLGGYAGAAVGYAENTTIENVTVNGAEVKTLSGSNAAVETAGGIAGVFDGTIKNIKLSGVNVEAGTFAGGVIGSARDAAVTVENADVTATVSGQVAGGIIGEVKNPVELSISKCFEGGKVDGKAVSAGIIGKVSADSSDMSLDSVSAPVISDTVVTAIISESDVSGIAVGEASAKIFCDKANGKTDVFDKIYYSSYQNAMGIFGTEEINSYQNSEYTANDLSEISYIAGETARDYIPLTTEFTALGDNALKLGGIEGGFKSFTLGGKTFKLETIKADTDGAVVYDAAKSAIKLGSAAVSETKAVLVYNDGLEAAIDVMQMSALAGKGTADDPYQISDADDFNILLQNAAESDDYYKLTADIKLTGIEPAEQFAGVLDGNGFVLYDYTGTGLFGRVAGTVKNTGFAGFKVSNNTSAAVGALAGEIDGGKIENCFVIADVSADGSSQDAGILAGRAVNGAIINGVVVSGRVDGAKALALGGAVGAAENAEISNVTSTAYVNGGKIAGGIVGDAEFSTVNGAVFGNMVESANGKAGGIVGTAANTKISDAYYDSQTARAASEIGTAKTTAELSELKLNGFETSDGYPVPAALSQTKNAKFAAGTAFAAMKINYLAGLNAGTVYNYTKISAAAEVCGNEVKLDTSKGLTLTLVPAGDFEGAEIAIARYSNPATSSGVNVSCNLVDATNGLMSDELTAILLKSKVGGESESFSFFTKADADAKQLGAVVVTDGSLYVDAVMPQGVKYTVNAVDENGRALNVTDAKNEGVLVETGSAKSVVITVTAENDTENEWGLHAVWGVIGK